ncbi:MAG: Asp23/Gls24 family envelope stress response protein [Anaerococcus sp.]|nr:Asp23/Gls24 family envelope stress response protein [Anaerococcus sp.]
MANSFVNGSVKIADEILDQIAIGASTDINGVFNQEDSYNFNKKNPRSKVKKVGEKLHFKLTVNLNENVNVMKTVKDIQKNVKNVVENMTGLPVDRVDVTVENLHIL